MQTRFDIEVTQDAIDKAIRQDSARCVAAQGIAKSIPDAHRITVDTQTVRFTIGDVRLQYLTPASLADYVVRFDAGDRIAPFRFRLRDPIKVARQTRTDMGKTIAAENKRRRKAAVGDSGQSPTASLSDAGERHKTGGPKPTRLVFGSGGKRSYGHRVLRYNQDRAAGYYVDEHGDLQLSPEGRAAIEDR